ncbi:S-methyl-5-thioribose-1-phosphate isomerase [bacterium]|nr:S-methyl-5-thioribose-1-phosphate isomerase [bacterium]
MRIGDRDWRTVWMEGGVARMIEQRLLPHRFEIFDAVTHQDTARAIRDMIVRGAPAIGAAGAYGLTQVYREAPQGGGRVEFIERGYELLRATRPTAQNLFHALEYVRRAVEGEPAERQAEAALAAAVEFADRDAEACRMIGVHGAELIPDGATVLTHCNAGWLACVDWGTALAPIYAAHRAGKKIRVLADETRPRCQGANLTAWELMQEGVPVEIIADNAAGYFLRRGEVSLVITGTDRVAANGDVVNKIGTYEKAVLARENGVPFYVALPTSTIDPECPDGDSVTIEERDAEEVLCARGMDESGTMRTVRISPPGAKARNPAFDVTPANLVKALITERGIFEASPYGVAECLQAEK